MLEVGGETDPLLRRPMSLYRFVRDKNGKVTGFELLYKVVGRGTELLSKVPVGETVGVLGPLGHGFAVTEGASGHCIVTGGTGVAPMAALAEKLVSAGFRPTVFYGARTAAEVVCRDDFQQPDIDLALFTDDGSLGAKGMVTEGLEDLLSRSGGKEKEGSGTAVYACGPHAMLAAVAALANRAGVQCQVSLEARMGCGLGACMSCAVRAAETGSAGEPRYLRVCLQGPVVDSRRVLWESET
jgi:dihydroorotate dehydrogenase electron transfer subunit